MVHHARKCWGLACWPFPLFQSKDHFIPDINHASGLLQQLTGRVVLLVTKSNSWRDSKAPGRGTVVLSTAMPGYTSDCKGYGYTYIAEFKQTQLECSTYIQCSSNLNTTILSVLHTSSVLPCESSVGECAVTRLWELSRSGSRNSVKKAARRKRASMMD